MRIGVPKEIKVHEYRVGMTPAAAREAVEHGHQVFVEHDAAVRGCIGLTDQGDGQGRLRWFVLEETLRGRGLGRQLVSELLATARSQGFRRLELETFSALTEAARLYRSVGFNLTWERPRSDWGAPIVYQHYALQL